VVIAELTLTF